MTLNPSNPRTKPRWLALVVVSIGLLTITAGVSFAAVYGAPGDTPYAFELDGNATDTTPPSGGAGGNRNLPDDWSAIYPLPADQPVGYLDEEFVDDHVALDETYFTGGSTKDDIDIDTVAGTPTGSGGWLRDKTSSSQPKADIIDAFAASYQIAGDTVVYFGMDRFSNDGATFAGFWFLQNAISFGPTANNGVGEIHGTHEPGDILVITDFTQGGAVEKLNVYEWVGPDYDGAEAVINDVFILKFAGTDCEDSPPDALACSKVNSTTVGSPWPFVPKSNVGPANFFQPGLFIEGGINISDLFTDEDPCFTNFVAETRASFSIDSTLSDFAHGSFNTCGGIEALKYHDLDANGSKGTTEPVLDGWTIYVDSNNSNTFDAGEPTGVTGTDGKVTFSNIVAGSYNVCETNKTGWTNSDPGGGTLCQTVVVGAGGAVATVDFGNYQDVTVKVIKYHDRNGDGSRDANGVDDILGGAGAADDEVLLSGWNFYVESGANEVQNLPGDGAYQATDSNGETTFTLKPGAAYKICEELKANWINSDPSGITICETTGTLVSGTAAGDLVFGNHPEYRVIVLTCNEATGELVVSTVDLDGSGTVYTAKDSQGTPPDLTGYTVAQEHGILCNLGGAQYNDLAPQTFNNGKIVLPK